jgi:hypothetical protein
MDLMETGCEDGRWIELAQDRVQWQALVLAVLNIQFLLSQCSLVSSLYFMFSFKLLVLMQGGNMLTMFGNIEIEI